MISQTIAVNIYFVKFSVSVRAFSCSRMIFDIFPGLFFRIVCYTSLRSKSMQYCALIVTPCGRKSIWNIPSESRNIFSIILPAESCDLNFIGRSSGDPLWRHSILEWSSAPTSRHRKVITYNWNQCRCSDGMLTFLGPCGSPFCWTIFVHI
jgi:hypothetical protein